jgi:hypothetical protein
VATDCPRKVDGLDVTEVDDGLVVFHEPTDTVHHLNPTAAVVLELCDGSRTTTDIAALLAQAYGLPDPPLEEADRCVRFLAEQGLIG